MRRVLLVVLALNVVVLITKNVIALRTGAVAVLGAALETGLDVLDVLDVLGVRAGARGRRRRGNYSSM